MSAPRRVPTIVFERRRDRTAWRWLSGSVFVHAALVFVLVADWSRPAPVPAIRTPGGEGPAGGGGGGGAEQVTYIALPAWEPPAAREEERPPEAEEFVIPTPQVVEVQIETPRIEIPRVQRVEVGADVLGRGPGSGGGPGAGTGSGGGVGSGQGTGIGSATGPGSGGEGGDIHPPGLRFSSFPFEDRPRSVRGKSFTIVFTVSSDGRVEEAEVSPAIRDAEFRRKFMALLRQWTFSPAVTREGVPVRGQAVVTITL